jgi:hypothetical protein
MATIHSLATVTTTFPIEADTVIGAIKDQVRQSVAHQPTESCSRVLRALCSEIDKQNPQPVKFPFTIPCETALVILARYRASIGVSKLCCPICWKLFNIFWNSYDTLQVHGHHSTVYPVELPPWLPLHIVKSMVDKFMEQLCCELTCLIYKQEQTLSTISGCSDPQASPSMWG